MTEQLEHYSKLPNMFCNPISKPNYQPAYLKLQNNFNSDAELISYIKQLLEISPSLLKYVPVDYATINAQQSQPKVESTTFDTFSAIEQPSVSSFDSVSNTAFKNNLSLSQNESSESKFSLPNQNFEEDNSQTKGQNNKDCYLDLNKKELTYTNTDNSNISEDSFVSSCYLVSSADSSSTTTLLDDISTEPSLRLEACSEPATKHSNYGIMCVNYHKPPYLAKLRHSNLLCNHCVYVQGFQKKAYVIITWLSQACHEFSDLINSRFHADSCVCYPNIIHTSNLEAIKRFQNFHLPQKLHREFIQHLLRLVRPNISELERSSYNSRIVVNRKGYSKILIPITFDKRTGFVVQIGYSNCFAKLKNDISILQDVLETFDLVIDYECPADFFSHSDLDDQDEQAASIRKKEFNQYLEELTQNKKPLLSLDLQKCELFSSAQTFDREETLPLNFGHYTNKGKRKLMEDRVVATDDLIKFCGYQSSSQKPKISFFGVYDGHGGTDVVNFVSRSLHYYLCESEAFYEQDYAKALNQAFQQVEREASEQLKKICKLKKYFKHVLSKLTISKQEIDEILGLFCLDTSSGDPVVSPYKTGFDKEARNPLLKKFKLIEAKLNELLKRYDFVIDEDDVEKLNIDVADEGELPLTSGCTALVVLIIDRQVIVANLGDSRCVLSRNNCIGCLTEDHRLQSNTKESERVRSIQGTYSFDGYLCGQLSVSRAFGNIYRNAGNKLSGLSSHPDIIEFEIQPEDEFLFTACDGVFESLSITDAASSIRSTLSDCSSDYYDAAQNLANLALSNNCEDNVSAIIIGLNRSKIQPEASYDLTPEKASLNDSVHPLNRAVTVTPYCDKCKCPKSNPTKDPPRRRRFCWNVLHNT